MLSARKVVTFNCSGRIAKIKEQDGLKIVVCPRCKLETEMDEYQGIFDQWLGDIRNKDGER